MFREHGIALTAPYARTRYQRRRHSSTKGRAFEQRCDGGRPMNLSRVPPELKHETISLGLNGAAMRLKLAQRDRLQIPRAVTPNSSSALQFGRGL